MEKNNAKKRNSISKATVNNWTLNIKGIKNLTKYSKSLMNRINMAKIGYTIIFTVFILYNIIFVTTTYYNTEEFEKKLLYTLIPDWTSLFIIILALIVFPKLKITFPGLIPISLFIVISLEIEFNIRAYSFDNLSSL